MTLSSNCQIPAGAATVIDAFDARGVDGKFCASQPIEIARNRERISETSPPRKSGSGYGTAGSRRYARDDGGRTRAAAQYSRRRTLIGLRKINAPATSPSGDLEHGAPIERLVRSSDRGEYYVYLQLE